MNAYNVCGKPLESGEKPWRVNDKIFFALKSSLLSKSLRYYTYIVLPKNLSSFLTFLPRFLPLFLSLALIAQQYFPLIL